MAISSRSSNATLTADNILKMVDPLDVFSRYSGVSIPLNSAVSSPLREDDKSPSFCLWLGDDTIMFTDFGMNKHGNCITFVMALFDISFKDAMIMIDQDFELGLYKSTRKKHVKIPLKKPVVEAQKKPKKSFKLRVRELKEYDLKFWNSFGIQEETLYYYNVVPLKGFYVRDVYIKADKLSYAYLLSNNKQVKIYQPKSEKLKFLSNTTKDSVQGLEQLPFTGKTVVLTSSMKDVMVLYEMGIHAIALSSEMQMPSKELMSHLASRFLNIYLFYDNDYNKTNNWGQIQAKKIMNEYANIKYNLKIPAKYQAKDPSDLVQLVGFKEARSIINSDLICQKQNSEVRTKK